MQSVVGLLALLLVSATLAQSPLEDCVKNFDANKDCFTYKSKVDASTLFTVEYNNYYKVLRTTSSAGPQSTYVLVIRGAPNPPISSSANATIQIPIADVAVLDTTVVTMVELLGQRTTIKGAYGDMISSPCYQKLRSESKTTEVSSTNDTLAASQLTEADVIFTSGFTQVPGRENRTVAQYASSDPGVINRAEWMEFVGQFYNREESAEAIVRDIDGRYKCVKEAAVAKGAGAGNPSIAWISYTLYEGAKSWSVSTAKFKQSYVEDAGATFFKASKSLFTDLNEFKAAIKDVDVVIDESFVSTDTPEGFAKEFGVDDSFKFVKNKQVYRVDKQQNPTGLFDWFESAVVFPNVVLQDVVSIARPTAIGADKYSRRYLRNIYTEQKVALSKDQCLDDPAKPLNVIGYTCDEVQKIQKESGALSVKSVANAGLGLVVAIIGAFMLV